ncbi:MAG: PilT/PilU family type 4a pilus ATPase [Clostridiales bacterium]|nr:PilT/PilU family type 4a pilus ATPase [Clostridiales bacterium]
MIALTDILKEAVSLEASDIFIVAGGNVSAKYDGEIHALSEEKVMPKETEALISEMYSMAGRSMDEYIKSGDDDFSFSVPGLARFRANAYKQRGSLAAVVRVVAFDIPDYREYMIPEEVMKLSELTHGMVLFTGTAGSGKSTTQACLVDRINENESFHIITLENPIEYLHRNKKSIVSQREIELDTGDYLSALRACLRQAPNVIQLGEMRDLETTRTAMTAAETGHLIFATLHTKGAVNAIDRIIDEFPAFQQDQIRVQLASVLRTVVSQQLLPGTDGELVPAFEIMHVNGAIKNMIRDNKGHQINVAISTGAAEGMISMDQSIAGLYREGKITKEVALEYADNPAQLDRIL